MKIYEAKNRNRHLTTALLDVWEQSVRATHFFLTDEEINRIKEYVPQALENVRHLVIAETCEESPAAFMGIENGRLEMLFILPSERGKGIGREMVLYGIRNYGINEVTVNLQNTQAVGFYEHIGFETYKHTDCDEQGGPYPLLYMRYIGGF